MLRLPFSSPFGLGFQLCNDTVIGAVAGAADSATADCAAAPELAVQRRDGILEPGRVMDRLEGARDPSLLLPAAPSQPHTSVCC